MTVFITMRAINMLKYNMEA